MSDEYQSSQMADLGTSQVDGERPSIETDNVIARIPDVERPRTSSRRGSRSRKKDGRIFSERVSMRLLVGAGAVLVVLAISLPFLLRGDGEPQPAEGESTAQAGSQETAGEAPAWEGNAGQVPPGTDGRFAETGFGGTGAEQGPAGYGQASPWSQPGPSLGPGPDYGNYAPGMAPDAQARRTEWDPSVGGPGRAEASGWDPSRPSGGAQYGYGPATTPSGPSGTAPGYRPGSTSRVPPGLPTAAMNRPSGIDGTGAYYDAATANRQAAYYQRSETPQFSANRPAGLGYTADTRSQDYRPDYRRSEYSDPQRQVGTAPTYSPGPRRDYGTYDPRYSPSQNYPRGASVGRSPAYPQDYDPRAAGGTYPTARPEDYSGAQPPTGYGPNYRQQPYRVYPTTDSSSATPYDAARYRAGGGAAGPGEAGVARLEGIIQDPSVRTSSYDSSRQRVY